MALQVTTSELAARVYCSNVRDPGNLFIMQNEASGMRRRHYNIVLR